MITNTVILLQRALKFINNCKKKTLHLTFKSDYKFNFFFYVHKHRLKEKHKPQKYTYVDY